MTKGVKLTEKIILLLVFSAVVLGIASVVLNIIILSKKTSNTTNYMYDYVSTQNPTEAAKTIIQTNTQTVHTTNTPPTKTKEESLSTTSTWTPPQQQCYQVSNDPGYKEAANLLLGSLDFSYDPCEDFYMFTCGSFLNKTSLKTGQPYNATAENAQANVYKNVAKFVENLPANASQTEEIFKYTYESCYNYYSKPTEDKSKTIYDELMAPFGGVPILNRSWTPINKSLLWEMIGTYESSSNPAITNPPSFFASQVSIDLKNSSQFSLFINQASLPSPRDFYLKPQFLTEINDYLESVKSLVLLFNQNVGGNMSDESNAYINQSCIDIVSFEVDLAMATVPDDLMRNHKQQYNPYTLDKLKIAYPNIDWDTYFKFLLSSANSNYAKNNYNVPQPTYLRALDEMLVQYDIKTLVNFVMLRLLQSNVDFIGSKDDKEIVQRIKRQTYKKKDITSDDDAVQGCMQKMLVNMPYAMGYTFVKYIPNKWEVQRDVQTMAYYIIDAFENMTETLPWMSDYSHQQIRDKISNLQVNVGWPYWFYNFLPSDEKTYIDPYHIYYQKLLTIDQNDFFHIYLVLSGAYQSTENFRLLEQTPDRRYFWMSPATFDSWYNPYLNSITFPYGVLNPPYYRYGYPQAFNFGGQGANAGHELTHGYDDEGIQFGPTGNLAGCDWNRCSLIDTNSSLGFIDMAQCVVSQYSSQCCPMKTGSVHCANGATTQGENIADIGGIQAAYNAYRNYVETHLNSVEEPRLPGLENFTPNQIFWMTFGYGWCMKASDDFLVQMLLTNPHSPFSCRVNQVMQDVPEFGKDFNCKKGATNLYPTDQQRCKVWTGI